MTRMTILTVFLFAQVLSMLSVSAYSQKFTVKAKMEVLLKKANPTTKLYFNKASDYLDIDGNQIPYRLVNYTYEELSTPNEAGFIHYIRMHCIANIDCIKLSRHGDTFRNAFALPFKSKDDAYEFLDLVDQLKKQ